MPQKKLSSLILEIIELLTNNSTETALQKEVASTIPLDEDEISSHSTECSSDD